MQLLILILFLLILGPASSAAKCQYLRGRIADQIRVVFGQSALNRNKVHCASSLKVFDVACSVVKSLDPKWMSKNSGGLWLCSSNKLLRLSSNWSHLSPLKPFQVMLACKLRLHPPGLSCAAMPAQYGIDDPTIQIVLPVILVLYYFRVAMSITEIPQCYAWIECVCVENKLMRSNVC